MLILRNTIYKNITISQSHGYFISKRFMKSTSNVILQASKNAKSTTPVVNNKNNFQEEMNRVAENPIISSHTPYHRGLDYEDLDDELKIYSGPNVPNQLFPEIIAVDFMENVVAGNKNPLPIHEQKHTLVGVKDDNSGLITANHILTSGKVNPISKKQNTVLDENINVKLEGKPQRFGELSSARIFLDQDENIVWQKNEAATQFVNQPHVYPKILEDLEKQKESIPIMRMHKDHSSFYDENGNNINDDEND